MSNTRMGDEVAIGLLAGPEDFRRLRQGLSSGLMAQVWQRFQTGVEQSLTKAGGAPFADLALAAAVMQRGDWASKAVGQALEAARQGSWLHPEAGCLTLPGMHQARDLCLATDWLWPVLNRDQREALLGSLLARGVENLTRSPAGIRDPGDGRGQLLLARRMDKDDPSCLHPRPEQTNNWDMWFSAVLYMAACLAERAWLKPEPRWPKLEWGHYHDTGYALDQGRIDRWKAIAFERITTVLANQIGPDGDYGEGIGYAAYGGQALVLALTVLDRTGGGNLFSDNVLKLPAWIRSQFPADIPFGAFNFNDARMGSPNPLPVLTCMAARSRNPVYQGFAIEALAASSQAPEVLAVCTLSTEVAAAPVVLPAAAIFSRTGTVVWRTAQDRTGIGFALQSGAHGGAHQHRDRNGFCLFAHGEYLVADTGDGRYADPPSTPRHDETQAHSCLLIDGRGQVGGNDDPRAGRLLEHRHEGDVSTLLADAGACYERIAGCYRRVVFLRPDILIMADRVEGDCEKLTWLLQGYNRDAKAGWTCRDRSVMLTRPNARLHVFFSAPPEAFAVGSGTLDGEPSGMLRLEAVIRGKSFGAVLVPSKPDEREPECEWHSDGVSMSIRHHGRAHQIRFGAETLMVNGQAFTA